MNAPTLTPSWWTIRPIEVREAINQRIMAIAAHCHPVDKVKDLIVDNEGRSTPVRIYLPNEHKRLPVILLIHGGAWIAGNIETHDNLARFLCSQGGAVVFSVGYALAPEAKFPYQLHQCRDVLRWILEHAAEYSIDTSKIAIAGDSAGGNMTAALCLLLRDNGGPSIALQLLINPATDLLFESFLGQRGEAFDRLRWAAQQYLSHISDATNPYASPLRADDLQNLPTAVILLAENDELRADGEAYARRLLKSGVSTHVFCQPGIGHLAGHGARASSLAKESLNVAVQYLRLYLK